MMNRLIKRIIALFSACLIIIFCTGCNKNNDISNLDSKNRNDLILYNDYGYNREIILSDNVETSFEGIDTTQFEKDILEVRSTILTSLEKITSSKKEIMEKDGAANGTCYIVKNSKTNDYFKFCDNGEAIYSNDETRIAYKFTSDDYSNNFKILEEAIKNHLEITMNFIEENFKN